MIFSNGENDSIQTMIHDGITLVSDLLIRMSLIFFEPQGVPIQPMSLCQCDAMLLQIALVFLKVILDLRRLMLLQ